MQIFAVANQPRARVTRALCTMVHCMQPFTIPIRISVFSHDFRVTYCDSTCPQRFSSFSFFVFIRLILDVVSHCIFAHLF